MSDQEFRKPEFSKRFHCNPTVSCLLPSEFLPTEDSPARFARLLRRWGSATRMLQVTAGILVDRGTVLACQRIAGADHAGKWEFPGGKRETGETLQDCLRRELEEELGIEVRIGPEVRRIQYRYPGREALELVFYAIAETRGTIRNRGFAALRWVPIGSLSSLDFLAADRVVIEALDRGDLVIPDTIGLRI